MNKSWMVLLLSSLGYSRRTAAFTVTRGSPSANISRLCSSGGRFTARIVPTKHLYYDQQKPRNVYEDIDSLNDQIDHLPTIALSELPPTPSDEKLTIVLHGTVVEAPGKLHHFRSQRESDEAVTKGLKRLTANILAGLEPPRPSALQKGKKKPKKTQTPSRLPTLRVEQRDLDLNHLSNLGALWQDLSQRDQITISFPHETKGAIELPVVSCPPTILAIDTFERMEQDILCGVPLVVSVEVIHAQRAQVSWFSNGKLVEADSSTYTPTKEDVGHKIQILVTPIGAILDGQEAYEFEKPVQAAPHLSVVNLRTPQWTIPPSSNDTVRIMTYNLLADQYGKQGMNHVSDDLLHRSHRMPKLLYEILAYHADIICLQEVDSYIYTSLYEPVLESQGYQGFFSCKLSGQQEGCAMFWSSAKFQAEDPIGVAISDLLLDDEENGAPDGWRDHKALLRDMPRIRGRIQELGQILQCVTLLSDEGQRRLIVGNTHLYYHPMGDHLRCLQAYGVCRKLNKRLLHSPRDDGADVPEIRIILCGDLNSDPTSGAIQLLRDRCVDGKHPTAWENLERHPKPSRKNTSPPPQESFTPVAIPTLKLPDSFPHLTSSSISSGDPSHTHCIPEFCGTLDYIFSSFDRATAAPTPTDEPPLPMPNDGMPSDHISLVADCQWNDVES